MTDVNARCGIAYGRVWTIRLKNAILMVQGGTYDVV